MTGQYGVKIACDKHAPNAPTGGRCSRSGTCDTIAGPADHHARARPIYRAQHPGAVDHPCARLDRGCPRALLPLLRRSQGQLHQAGVRRRRNRAVAHPPSGALRIEDSHFLTRPPVLNQDEAQRLTERYAARGAGLPHDAMLEATTPHIASPEVIVDHGRRMVRMYFHGLEAAATQATRVAESADGAHFMAGERLLAPPYLRIFSWAGQTYGLTMPGQLHRATDGVSRFEPGPLLFNPNMRHCALLVRDGILYVFWTQVGHARERILLSTIDLAGDWHAWRESAPVEILRPQRAWEGAAAPVSRRCAAPPTGPSTSFATRPS